MAAMLRIYQRFWQVNWAEQWQYRANLLMYLLYWLVSPVVYLAVWTTIANSQGSVSGLTANDFITYYLTLLIVDQLTSDITIHILAYKIQDGTLSGDLLRPVHPDPDRHAGQQHRLQGADLHRADPDLDRALPALPARFQRGHAWARCCWRCPAILLGFCHQLPAGRDDHLPGLLDHAGLLARRVLLDADHPLLRAVCPAAAHAAASSRISPVPALPDVQLLPDPDHPQPADRRRRSCATTRWAWSGWSWRCFLFRWIWRAGVKRFSAVGA